SFQPAPDDWMVVITDVMGSTAAIEAGRHKDVNVAGVAAIIALRNRYAKLELPFVFGGDGATFLLPGALRDKAWDVLAETRRTCRELFDLELRVGMVSMQELRAAGHDVQVARLQVSKIYPQAVLTGSGLDHAEKLIKDEIHGVDYRLPADFQPQEPANFVGVFCPFQDIRGSREEILSLIVKIVSEDSSTQQQVLGRVLGKIEEILDGPYHPLAEKIQIRWANARQLDRLVSLTARGQKGLRAMFQGTLHRAFNTVTKLIGNGVLVRDADFRKYDGSLKMVVACSNKARCELEALLASMHQQGLVCYGLHVSDKALITCGLHMSSGQGPIHFVDGADGGYAFAARQLKQQLSANKTSGI
ncbi:MAG TPA: DUF3095 family protein, partial [Candidatus Obscuribacterales bacterium]